MGSTPSKRLVKAAVRGDAAGVQKALDEGADVNALEGKRNSTALFNAARGGSVRCAQILLCAGAKDLRDNRGMTALHAAAKRGNAGMVGLLLDRGADFLVLDRWGNRPIDWAAGRKKAHIVRLMEARTCPFLAEISTAHKRLFGGERWTPEWMVVHRARPWDNPSIARASVVLCVYPNKGACATRLQLHKPELRPLSVDENDCVIFELVTDQAIGKRGGPSRHASVRCRAPRPVFEWLLNVLSDAFESGRGPAFDDDSGDVVFPASARTLVAQYATSVFTGDQPAYFRIVCLPRSQTADEASGMLNPREVGWQIPSPTVGAAIEAYHQQHAAGAAAIPLAPRRQQQPTATAVASAAAAPASVREAAPVGSRLQQQAAATARLPMYPTLHGTGPVDHAAPQTQSQAAGVFPGEAPSAYALRMQQRQLEQQQRQFEQQPHQQPLGPREEQRARQQQSTLNQNQQQQREDAQYYQQQQQQQQPARPQPAQQAQAQQQQPQQYLQQQPQQYWPGEPVGASAALLAQYSAAAAAAVGLERASGAPAAASGSTTMVYSRASAAGAAAVVAGAGGTLRRSSGARAPPSAQPQPQQRASSLPTAASSTLPRVPGAAAPAPARNDEDPEFDAEPPADFLCPITLDLLLDPVVCVGDGHTYSREGISQWLASHRSSPKTNERLTDTRVVPNHLLRGQVLDWVGRHRIDNLDPAERVDRLRAAGGGSGPSYGANGVRRARSTRAAAVPAPAEEVEVVQPQPRRSSRRGSSRRDRDRDRDREGEGEERYRELPPPVAAAPPEWPLEAAAAGAERRDPAARRSSRRTGTTGDPDARALQDWELAQQRAVGPPLAPPGSGEEWGSSTNRTSASVVTTDMPAALLQPLQQSHSLAGASVDLQDTRRSDPSAGTARRGSAHRSGTGAHGSSSRRRREREEAAAAPAVAAGAGDEWVASVSAHSHESAGSAHSSLSQHTPSRRQQAQVQWVESDPASASASLPASASASRSPALRLRSVPLSPAPAPAPVLAALFPASRGSVAEGSSHASAASVDSAQSAHSPARPVTVSVSPLHTATAAAAAAAVAAALSARAIPLPAARPAQSPMTQSPTIRVTAAAADGAPAAAAQGRAVEGPTLPSPGFPSVALGREREDPTMPPLQIAENPYSSSATAAAAAAPSSHPSSLGAAGVISSLSEGVEEEGEAEEEEEQSEERDSNGPASFHSVFRPQAGTDWGRQQWWQQQQQQQQRPGPTPTAEASTVDSAAAPIDSSSLGLQTGEEPDGGAVGDWPPGQERGVPVAIATMTGMPLSEEPSPQYASGAAQSLDTAQSASLDEEEDEPTNSRQDADLPLPPTHDPFERMALQRQQQQADADGGTLRLPPPPMHVPSSSAAPQPEQAATYDYA